MDAWPTSCLFLLCSFVPGGAPGGRPLPSRPLPPPTRDVGAIKVNHSLYLPVYNAHLNFWMAF